MLSSATKTAASITKGLAENDLRNTVRDTVREVENDGRDILHNVTDLASEAGDKVRGFFDKTMDGTNRVTHNVEAEIKSNPVRSSLVALGAGFILGALLARR